MQTTFNKLLYEIFHSESIKGVSEVRVFFGNSNTLQLHLDDRNDRFTDNKPQYTFNQKAADKVNKPKGSYRYVLSINWVIIIKKSP